MWKKCNMKKEDNILYIFLHIPKCAGSTFSHHIRNNFKNEEILELNKEFLAPIIKNYDLASLSEKEWGRIKEQCTAKLLEKTNNLSKKEKKDIKVIFGHYVPYGIHKYFNKSPRYITFLRDPTKLTISAYNYLRTEHNKRKLEKNMTDLVLRNGVAVSFKKFLSSVLNKFHVRPFSTYQYLHELGYFNQLSPQDIKQHLKNFYFVGITEKYSTDAIFLYYKMGITKFFENQNISLKYHSPNINEYKKIEDVLRHENSGDYILYNEAIKLNRQFKIRHPKFMMIVLYMKIKQKTDNFEIKKISLIESLYKLSATLKRHSKLYSKLIRHTKSI